ncbi:MAG: metalloregulator ArsR/SmtB family transcription factor [Elusimicrobiota bacterium]
MEQILRILKIVSDKTRLRIINMLLKREVCVCELRDALKISQPAVSKHIKKLKTIGLVKERQVGYWSYYSIFFSNKKIKRIIDFLMKEIADDKIFKMDIEILKKVSCKLKKSCL